MTSSIDLEPAVPIPEPNSGGGAAYPVQAPQERRWKPLILPLKLVVSAGLLYWVLSRTSLREIADAVGGASPWFLVLALGSPVLGYYIGAHRWSRLLRAQRVKASIDRLMVSYVVAMFFSNFLPSTIGGDGIRAYDTWRLGASRATAVAVILVERLLGLLALIMLSGAAIVLSRNAVLRLLAAPSWIPWVAGVGAFGIVVACALLTWWNPPASLGLGQKLGRFRQALSLFRQQKPVLFKALALSLVLQANVVLQYFLIATALAFPMSLLDCFLVIPPCILIMMLPVSINGIGIRESVFVLVLAAFGVSQPQALAFAWLNYGLVFLQGIVGSVVYAFRK